MYRSKASDAKVAFASKLRRQPTRAERLLRRNLNKFTAGTAYRVQFQVLMRGYVLDFYIPRVRLAIEVDGSSHDDRIAYDLIRDAILRRDLGIQTIRFTNEQVAQNVVGVVLQILQTCKSRPEYKTWNEGRKSK